MGLWQDFEMAVGSGRSTPVSEIQKNEIFIDFHDLTSMFATKLDCQLVQVLMFCSCSCPLHEQGAGWLFEIISISEYEFRPSGAKLLIQSKERGGGVCVTKSIPFGWGGVFLMKASTVY